MTRHVMLATDVNMLPYALTAIYSLAVNVVNPTDYVVTLVVDGDVEQAQHDVDKLDKQGVYVRVVPMTKRLRACTPFVDRLTLPTFARLELCDYVSLDVDRVLYIDADVLIVDELDELFTAPMDNICALVVHERGHAFSEKFNAGVLMINMNTWRALNVTELACKMAIDGGVTSDEDILNFVLHDHVRFVSCVYNYSMFDQFCMRLQDFWRNYADGRRDLRIVHYQGDKKPWDNPRMDLGALYTMYANRCVDKDKQNVLIKLFTRWGNEAVVDC